MGRCESAVLFNMIVVYVSDENFLSYTEKSARSLLKIHPDARVIIVSPEKLETPFENVILPLDDLRHDKSKRISTTAYLKCYLTDLDLKKIIYLDGDTIIQKPIDELWEIEPEYIAITESHDYGKEQAKALGVEQYGMTSVMVMNLENLREINFKEKCLEVARSGYTPSTGWQSDETCINIVLKDKLTFIDKKWNYCYNRAYEEPMDYSEANILHVCGANKKKIDYNPYEEIRPVLEYIKGKSVAIVGNAATIFDQEYGEEIDNHDIIIRFNRGFITKPESQGSRTDIVFLATELNIDEKSVYKAWFYVNRSKSTKCGDLTIKDEMRARLKSLLGKQPSTGFIAIDICREAKAKSIDIYGFDKNVPTFYNPEGYKTPHDYDKEQEIIKNYMKTTF